MLEIIVNAFYNVNTTFYNKGAEICQRKLILLRYFKSKKKKNFLN
jgi:hypothetical protein